MAFLRPHWPQTLQTQFLVALVLIGLLPLGLVGLGVATLDRQALSEQSTRELTGMAQGLASQMDVYLDGLLSTSRAIAALPEIVSMEPERQEALLKELFHHYHAFTRLSTFDPTGQRLASSRPGDVQSMAVREAFQSAVQHGHQAWQVARTNSPGRPVLIIDTPIRDADRQVVGVLGAMVDLETLSAVVRRVHVGGGGRAFVLDASAGVLLHPDWSAIQEQRDYSWLGVPTGHRPAGVGTVRYTLDDEAWVAGYATVPEVNWTVVVERPELALLAPARRSWRLALAGLATSAACALLMAVFLARRLTRPVRELAAAAQAFGAGDSTVALPASVQGNGELRILIDAFATMRESVMKREEGLRQLAAERAELAARAMASEQRYHDLVQDLDAIVWEASAQTLQFSFVSQRAEAMLGYAVEQWLTVPDFWVQHLHPDDRERVMAFYRAVSAQGKDHQCEYRALAADGRVVWLNDMVHAVADDEGQVRQLRGVMVDITERQRAEEERRQVEVQSRHTQRLESLGVLAGGIAHDFNNILTAILGYAEITLDDVPQDGDIWRNLQQILIAGKRAQDLVRQILAFSRQSHQERKPLHLHMIIREALALLRASLPSTIAIRQNIDREAGVILADATQMHQVLLNLCTNAEHAMRDQGGVLEVAWEAVEVDASFASRYRELEPGAYARLTVRDTGHGIAPATLDRIFEPFFTTKGVGEGTGMGLATVHGIVASHGGMIRVDSRVGQGTTFELYFPRIDMESTSEAVLEACLTPGVGRILFVEDEEPLASLGQIALERLGYDVTVRTSSVEALEAFRSAPQRFDLVITDYTMPNMTGAVLARELRGLRPDIPIILCTGFSHAMNAQKAHALGIDAFLMKPLVMRDLAVTIQRVLAQRPPVTAR